MWGAPSLLIPCLANCAYGQDKEVFFAQEHLPGRLMQLDWTNANELGVTIEGVLKILHGRELLLSLPLDQRGAGRKCHLFAYSRF